jgi:hypothetical protein
MILTILGSGNKRDSAEARHRPHLGVRNSHGSEVLSGPVQVLSGKVQQRGKSY